MFIILHFSCLINSDLYQERLESIQDFDGDGFSNQEGDCDDSTSNIHPNAIELCDYLDNDCNGHIDDVVTPPVWFFDNDQDGYGNSEITIKSCYPPNNQFVEMGGDCNDTVVDINPFGVENWDNAFVDNDCNGQLEGSILSVNNWFPFTNLTHRGNVPSESVALFVKNTGTTNGSLHWMRGLHEGISLSPIISAFDGRVSESGIILSQPIDEPDSLLLYGYDNYEDIQHRFYLPHPIQDFEILGDVTGDGMTDWMGYYLNNQEYSIVFSPLEGHQRVEVWDFDLEISTPHDILDGNYFGIGDWTGDGLNDLGLHHFMSGNVSIVDSLEDPDFLQPHSFYHGSCESVQVGNFLGGDAILMACLNSEQIDFYLESDGYDAPPAYSIFPPDGGVVLDFSILDDRKGGLSVVYGNIDSYPQMAILLSQTLIGDHVITGEEPHVETSIPLSRVQHVGQIHIEEEKDYLFLQSISPSYDEITLISVPQTP